MGAGARNYSISTLNRLFALTGNRCAKCKTQKIVLPDRTLIGQICHINAANVKGERYDEKMTDIERASFDNLIILCANCHIETNNVDLFPSEELRRIKAEHENDLLKEKPSKEEMEAFLIASTYDVDFTGQEDWGILELIIKHTLANSPKMNLSMDEIMASPGFIDLKEKVKLNFDEGERAFFSDTYRTTTARSTTIESYLKKMSEEDPLKVEELHNMIIQKFCSLPGIVQPESRIGSVKNIEDLAICLIPEAKQNSPEYRSIARGLVIQTFEFCAIGKKIDKGPQLSLFD